MKEPVSIKVFTFESTAMAAAFPHTQPNRQPVMLNVLDSEWNSSAMSVAPGISSTLGGRYPSNATSEYALSNASRTSSRRHRSTTASRYSRDAVAEVGLLG